MPTPVNCAKHGSRIKVQGQPLEVLATLLERPGEVVTREELQKRLWPAETYVEPRVTICVLGRWASREGRKSSPLLRRITPVDDS